ncbi:transposase family protein [Nonomuraea sp. NPDC050536]|uniref:transposase family protein n=1 Tax=Nonomuraea sp. NPDC050536 TaxID=3364366 RepID=UPI0037CC9979
MTKNKKQAGDAISLVYQCRLPLSTSTVAHVADLLRKRLKAIGSRVAVQACGPDRGARAGSAAPRPARRRPRRRQPDLGHDHEALVRRGRRPAGGQGPRLDRAIRKVAKRGGEVVLIDGTLIPTHRRTGKDNRPNYCGKHKCHGLHFLALTDEHGRLIWISAAWPGRTHDITAARRDHILNHLRAAGLGALADLGFLGLDPDGDDQVVITGYKATRTHKLNTGQKTANKVISAARAPVEHGFAHLKNRRVLTKLRSDPARATNLLRALLVLTVRVPINHPGRSSRTSVQECAVVLVGHAAVLKKPLPAWRAAASRSSPPPSRSGSQRSSCPAASSIRCRSTSSRSTSPRGSRIVEGRAHPPLSAGRGHVPW